MLLRKNPAIEEAPLQGELMLFDANSSKFFVLNPTMAFVWQHCDGNQSTTNILQKMMDAFSGVDPVSAEVDLTNAVEDLKSKGLIFAETIVAVG